MDFCVKDGDTDGFKLYDIKGTLLHTCTLQVDNDKNAIGTYTFTEATKSAYIMRYGSKFHFYGASITRASGSGSGESTLPTNLAWITDPSAEVEI